MKGYHNRNNYFKTEDEILITAENSWKDHFDKLLNEENSVEEVEQNLPEDERIFVDIKEA